MARTLDVYLHRHLCGHLVQDDHGAMRFSYAESWLSNPASMALSNSLPLREQRFSRNECRGFFGGILPEESKREMIARNLGISPRNDFSMLEQIGGECAGAVTFLPASISLPEREDNYRAVTETELASILKMLPTRPLMAGEDGVRLSLAGAQDKIAVCLIDGKISIPLGGAPSTHILKPAIAHFQGTVFNEALCMNLGRAVGVSTAPVQTGSAEGIDYLLVERYDRHRTQTSSEGPQIIERMHQEDFCQALGIASENKYQNEGGPSLKQCFDLVREISSVPVLDLQNLLDAVILNFLVGNHDAHGKNFSLTYHAERNQGSPEKRFAPMYDILCTVYYPELARQMAMKIGGEYDSRKIRPQNFDQLAEEAGLAKPIVRRRVSEVGESILAKLPDLTMEHPVALDIAGLIRERCERTLSEFKK